MEVKAGRFARTFIIACCVIPLPATLRERGEDILLLARDLLLRYARRRTSASKDFDADAVRVLLDYPGPATCASCRTWCAT